MDWDGNRLPSPAQSSKPFLVAANMEMQFQMCRPLHLLLQNLAFQTDMKPGVLLLVHLLISDMQLVQPGTHLQRKRLNLFGILVFGSAYSVMTVLVML